MRKPEIRLPVLGFAGSPQMCGFQYGDCERENILGFLCSQFPSLPRAEALVSGSWSILQEYLPEVASFCRGLAEGAGLTIPEAMLLLLHEELIHQEHCSVIGLSPSVTRDGRGCIGQNWDWPATVYSWPKLLQFTTPDAPISLTYAFPGLWCCAGLNEDGLALCWSGAGYWPNIPPIVGVPTYALIADLLRQSTVEGALRRIESVPHAGCFIFFLMDRTGELAIVEAWPSGQSVRRGLEIGYCTNHFLTSAAVAAVRQTPPKQISESTTAERYATLQAQLENVGDKIESNFVREALSATDVRVAYSFSDTKSGYQSMTIDSFCLYPDRAEVWNARGLPDRHEFVRYSLHSDSTRTNAGQRR